MHTPATSTHDMAEKQQTDTSDATQEEIDATVTQTTIATTPPPKTATSGDHTATEESPMDKSESSTESVDKPLTEPHHKTVSPAKR